MNLQRAYQIVCFMVGSDPEKYKELADETKLPEDRQEELQSGLPGGGMGLEHGAQAT